jgi:hypothetical protein
MNMARINSISHKFYSVIYLLIITIIGVICALNATYDVMIGGTPFYFCYCGACTQSIFALRESERSRNLAGLGLILLVIGLIYSCGFMFLTHLKAIVLLPSVCLTLFGIPSISTPAKTSFTQNRTVMLTNCFGSGSILRT